MNFVRTNVGPRLSSPDRAWRAGRSARSDGDTFSRHDTRNFMSAIRKQEALACRGDVAECTSALLQTRQGWGAVLRTVRRVLHGTNDAEDLLHSAFIRLAEYPHRETVANPAAFLVRTAANLAVDEHRRRLRREIPSAVTELMEVADDQPMQT